ncbi:secretory carrier-associated membrane protein 1-like isoform X1 [Lethenteron reissneri]|uniref:secretory carrier-associated membrane protein 1-like isoform X1 n=1 Tax=Lethenteron reissneri TaxID=7753 RepID=UPI002AB7F1CD|nr:secretory carrier-associated membrane protein 1-like isoform X1 [Lethenteron reissneri]
MSDFDSNPFADPEVNSPFRDPAVTQVTRQTQPALNDYNPFGDGSKPGALVGATPAVLPTSQPAVMQPTEEPPPYTAQGSGGYGTQGPSVSAAAQADLLRRQEELEKKAAELDRREREMQTQPGAVKKNNWPPLPTQCPVGPCFYQDIPVEIPVEFQKTVRMLYYMWMFHAVTLFLNLLGCLAWFCVNTARGIDFGMAILWFLLFTPCSFVCWFRPVYKAFRSDSSFNFFLFFFIFFCQFVVHVMQSIGIPGWGNCGWIASLEALNHSIAVGIILMLLAAFFTGSAVLSVVMLKKVHSLYRQTGASFEKAQQEFATGVMSNRTVQNAAATAATSAARNTFTPN